MFIVRCSGQDKGAAAKKPCDVSCIACGLCVKDCPSGAIQIQEGCAWIDESRCLSCGACAAGCPRKVVADMRGIIR